MKWFHLTICAILLTGCSGVIMNQPFPASELTAEEKANFKGVWQIGEEEAVCHLRFDTHDQPWIAFVKDENDSFELTQTKLYITKQADKIYVSLQTEPEKESYFFAEIRLTKNHAIVLVWTPKPEAFKTLTEQELLKGSYESNGDFLMVQLESTPEEILACIATHSALFNYTDPIILRKIN